MKKSLSIAFGVFAISAMIACGNQNQRDQNMNDGYDDSYKDGQDQRYRQGQDTSLRDSLQHDSISPVTPKH